MNKIDITTAVEFLAATQVTPRRWEHYASETRTFWRVTRRDLEALATMLDKGHADAYSVWCAGGNGVEVRPSTKTIDRTWPL